MEILYVLYKEIMAAEDIFILSKGHGCLALYAIFMEMGIISEEELNTFCSYDSRLGGHPHRLKLDNIYASTGSLGHGLPMAVGVALSKKIQGSTGRVFCLIGDGESNEGSVWESIILAEKLKLDNLICIVDYNNSQIRSLPMKTLGKKFDSFGWAVEKCDGHSISSLVDTFSSIVSSSKPISIICNTIKGKGIIEMENNMFAWHHGPPDDDQYNKFCEELDA
jgi:transketolase